MNRKTENFHVRRDPKLFWWLDYYKLLLQKKKKKSTSQKNNGNSCIRILYETFEKLHNSQTIYICIKNRSSVKCLSMYRLIWFTNVVIQYWHAIVINKTTNCRHRIPEICTYRFKYLNWKKNSVIFSASYPLCSTR